MGRVQDNHANTQLGNNSNEHVLVEEAKRGNAEAFNKLMEMHINEIYNLCYRLTSNKADAKDLCQETFARAFEKINLFSEKSSFSTWVHRIAVNLWISKKRRKVKIVPLDETIETEKGEMQIQIPDPSLSLEKEVEKKHVQEVVQQQLSLLEADLRLVIILRYIEGKSYEEIAEICKCRIGTVGSRIYRALQRLRNSLLPLLDEIYEKKI